MRTISCPTNENPASPAARIEKDAVKIYAEGIYECVNGPADGTTNYVVVITRNGGNPLRLFFHTQLNKLESLNSATVYEDPIKADLIFGIKLPS